MTNSKNNDTNNKEYSLGESLRLNREKLGLSVGFIAKELNLKERDIKSIENDDFSQISQSLYLSGIILEYSKIVKIEKKDIVKKINYIDNQKNKKTAKSKLKIDKYSIHSPRKDVFILSFFITLIIMFILLFYYNYKIKTNHVKVNEFIKNYQLK